MKLSIKQTQAIDYLEDDITNELLFGGGAGGGKSILGCYWQIKRRLKYPNTKGLIGRASLKTLKETTLQSFFFVAKEQGLKAGIHYKYNQQSNIIYFPNESQILLKDLFLYPSDPNFDELGSLEITDAFIDECNQIVEKAKNIVKSRIRYQLDENGLVPKVLMTCNPAKNWTYTEFYSPDKKGELPENKKFIQSLLNDNPNISQHYKGNLLTLDENSKQRLLYGNWEYSSDPAVLIQYENIINCFSNTFVESGAKFITADIARYGRDKTVIGVWDGWRLIKIVTIDKSGLDYVADEIKKLANAYKVPLSNIIVDEDGVGGGVKDFVKCKGFVNNSSPIVLPNQVANFTNLKSQCYFGLSDKINKNEVFFSFDGTDKEKTIEELQYVKQAKFDSDGKKSVLRKEDVKELLGRSPDYSDMIMMRYWFELKPAPVLWKMS
jgi:phage terminase large subunit